MTGSQAFRKALLRVHDGVTGSSKTLLKGHKRPQDRQSPDSIPEKARPVITGNCAICRLLKIVKNVTKVLDVVNSDEVSKDRGTGKKRGG